ncbi:MAG: PH domain-containing protein [bacterium]|nr:PH domain-containing protein [bacterium]
MDPERLIVCASTHWMKYVINALKNHFLVFLGIVLLFAANLAVQQSVAIITCVSGALLALYAHHNFFHKLLSESMFDIFITTERIIYFDDSLIISNNEHEIPSHRIAGIEVSQEGVIQNMLNYGTLWIDTGGSTADFKRSIPYVSNPEELSEKIAQLVHNE